MEKSLFERIGSENTIVAAANLFYKKVLADSELIPYFKDLPMEKQHMKMVAFMARAFGGPEQYTGRDLRSSHKNLVKNKSLSDQHFDLMVKHLMDTLKEMNITKELIDEVFKIISDTRSEVLNR